MSDVPGPVTVRYTREDYLDCLRTHYRATRRELLAVDASVIVAFAVFGLFSPGPVGSIATTLFLAGAPFAVLVRLLA